MELKPEQIILLGLLAPAVIQGIKLLAAWIKKPIDRKFITVFLFIVSLFLAYIWARPALPVWPVAVEDPAIYAGLVLQFIGTLIGIASAIAGFAVIIYNLLLQKVFDALSIGKDRVDSLSTPSDVQKRLNEL
jgi:hypothetical protein